MADKPNVKDLMTRALEDARADVLAGRDYMRTFYAVGPEGKLTMIAAPCEGPDADIGLIRYLKLQFIADGVTEYAMVSEAWSSADPTYSRTAGNLPENDPEREEVLIGLAVQRTRVGTEGDEWIEKRVTGRCKVTRNPTAVGEIEWPGKEDQLTGRFFELLPPKGFPTIPPEMRERMKQMLKEAKL